MASTVKKHDRVELLRSVALFSGCSTKELGRIATLTTPVVVDTGHVLAREGEPGREFFVIVDGTAVATIEGAQIGTLGPGLFFGEMALLDGGPRVATVTARSPMVLLVLNRAEFNQLIEAAMPSVARKMLTVLGQRLRDSDVRSARADHPLHSLAGV